MDLCSVAEDELGKLDGGGGGPDGALEIGLGEEGEAADVVEVSVGDEDGVWEAVTEPCKVAVQFIRPTAALEKSAIDEESRVVVLEKVAGAGDFASSGAERGDGKHGVCFGTVLVCGYGLAMWYLPRMEPRMKSISNASGCFSLDGRYLMRRSVEAR